MLPNIVSPIDMAVVLVLHKFSQQATIDHHGPSTYSGHYTILSTVAKVYCDANKIKEFEMILIS